MIRRILSSAAAACVIAAGSPAWAQDAQPERVPSYLKRQGPAPHYALEIGGNAGYALPVGGIRDRLPIGRVAGASAGVGIDIGYRFNPRWSITSGGQFHMSSPDERLGPGASVRGATFGLDGTYHALPFQRVDPWLSAGSGYRLLWAMPAGPGAGSLIHG